MPQLYKANIEERTKEYWDLDNITDVDRYTCYSNELLGRELQFAEGEPTRLPHVNTKVHTLAVTVGTSFEPLLQLVCVLRPKRVVLILNKQYSGTPGLAHGSTLCRLMLQLASVPDLPVRMRPALAKEQIILEVLAADTPTEVFSALRKTMQLPEAIAPDGYVNVVDITGAKKSMVVGAFLYAAHSELPISYVDFDKYDARRGKPFGYTCKIGTISNPYKAFHLRDWEQVKQLYIRYDFRRAVEIIGDSDGILGAMRGSIDDQVLTPLFKAEDIAAVEKFKAILQMYDAWDSGDFAQASKYPTYLPTEKRPSAIGELGSTWRVLEDAKQETIKKEWIPTLYDQPRELMIYGEDELARISRLIKYRKDFRAAFLRAGSLSEILMTARLVCMIEKIDVKKRVLGSLSGKTPRASELLVALRKPAGTDVSLKGVGIFINPDEYVTISDPMKSWWNSTTNFNGELGCKDFIELRNVLTHQYSTVSEDLAKDALTFVAANLGDYAANFAKPSGLITTALGWDELCRECRLTFLPPKLFAQS